MNQSCERSKGRCWPIYKWGVGGLERQQQAGVQAHWPRDATAAPAKMLRWHMHDAWFNGRGRTDAREPYDSCLDDHDDVPCRAALAPAPGGERVARSVTARASVITAAARGAERCRRAAYV